MLDKDDIVPELAAATDEDYWVKKPSANYFDDCSNEFWWLSTYVIKGLRRNELVFAIDHLYIMQNLMLTMLSWEIGCEFGFSMSVGKNYKYLDKYVDKSRWEKVMQTYSNDNARSIWTSLWLCCELYRESSKSVGVRLGYAYPEYDDKVTAYLEEISENYII